MEENINNLQMKIYIYIYILCNQIEINKKCKKNNSNMEEKKINMEEKNCYIKLNKTRIINILPHR